MATLNFIKRKDVKNIGSLGNVIAYCTQEYKTKYQNGRLISGINCMPETTMKDFISTKKRFHKEEGVQYYYAVQSFDEGLKFNPVLAHNMAREWAERCYPDHEVLVATHLDTDSIHSHIIINSVNMKTGYKIHQITKELEQMRKVNDEICIKYGLPVCVPKVKPKVKKMTAREYFIAKSGKSWKFRMINLVEDAMKVSGSKAEFIKTMNDRGYDVKWTDERKYITYISKENPNQRCRDNNMHETKLLKENMEEEFEIRKRIKIAQEQEQSDDFRFGESGIGNDSRKEQVGYSAETAEQLQQSTEFNIGRSDRNNGQGYDGGLSQSSYNGSQYRNEESGGSNTDSDDRLPEGNRETGWESERAIYFADKQSEEYGYGYEKEVAAYVNRNNDSSTSAISDSLYFIGNLFEMIDNQKKKPSRKHGRLSRKEIEKRIAHGQKISQDDGYEQSM